MNLYILRKPNPNGTPGMLFDDNKFLCYTLEDRVRVDGKVPGDTAIPSGRYRAILSFSNHFQRILPEILGIYNFDGVFFHGGETTEHTKGCVLTGQLRTGLNTIEYSYSNQLCEILKKNEEHWVEIFNAYPYRYDLT
jgi:hypothetical protein